MGNEGKSERRNRQAAAGPKEHFATRRKILRGLAGVPVFLTFSNRADAVAESFGNCIQNALGIDDLSPDNIDGYYIDQNNNFLYIGKNCNSNHLAFGSTGDCVESFITGALEHNRPDLLPKDNCPNTDP